MIWFALVQCYYRIPIARLCIVILTNAIAISKFMLLSNNRDRSYCLLLSLRVTNTGIPILTSLIGSFHWFGIIFNKDSLQRRVAINGSGSHILCVTSIVQVSFSRYVTIVIPYSFSKNGTIYEIDSSYCFLTVIII